MKKKTKLIYSLIVLLSIMLVFGLVILFKDPFSFFNDTNKTTEDKQDSVVVEKDLDKDIVKDLWDKNSLISKDYVGTISFESGLINLPFVQGKDNNTYYRTNWETMKYDEEGSIFLDSSNSLDDQNLILIGHYVYDSYDSSGTHMFTPLAKLVDEENYDTNKYLKLYLHNEVRRYEIAYVYYCELIEEEFNGEKFSYAEDGFEFYYPNYTCEQFDKYISNVSDKAFYDTDVSISYDDKMLTLQTCVKNHDELREVVLLKEIGRTSYSD